MNIDIKYGQAFRIRRICDSEEMFRKRFQELSGDFVKKGFKRKLWDSQILNVNAKVEKVFFVRKYRMGERHAEQYIYIYMCIYMYMHIMVN